MPGQSANFTIIAKVNATGIMTNYVNATSDLPDPHPGDNTSSSTINGQPVADVAVTKSVTPSTANYGQTVTHSITVTNNGPSEATGVIVID